MKKTILVVMLLILGIRLQGQNIEFTYFNKTYGATDTINILAASCVSLSDSTYMVIGNYALSGFYAAYTMLLNSRGDITSIKQIDYSTGTNELGTIDWGARVVKDNDHVLVAYEKKFSYPYQYDIKLAKLNYNGDTTWVKRYDQIGRQYALQIIKTPDNGYMIAGMEGVLTNDTVKAYALKIDSEGNFEWDKRYLMGNDARFFTVQHTPWDGGYIFGGMGYSTTTGYDMFVVKTLANGDTLWTKRYGNELNDCGAKVNVLTTYEEWQVGQAPKYLMTSCHKEGTIKKLYIAKLDESGLIQWEKKHGFIPNISSFQVFPIIKANKSFVGSGYYQPDGYTPQPFIAAFHEDGSVDWVSTPTLNPDKHVYLKDLQPTPDGGYVLAGYQYNDPQTAWVLKIDSLGNTCSYIGCDSTVVVEVMPGIPSHSNSEVATMVYPVPASTHLFIRYQIPAGISPSGGAVWRLYDALGRQVAEEILQGNTGTEQVSVEHLPAGVYYYRVKFPISGQTVASGKVIISD